MERSDSKISHSVDVEIYNQNMMFHMISRDKTIIIELKRPILLIQKDLSLIEESISGMKRQISKTVTETLLIQKETVQISQAH